MIEGTYEDIDWDAWECSATGSLLNNVARWAPKRRYWSTCGSAALSTVTGLHPGFVERCLPRGQKHWSDHAAIKFLRKRNFKVRQLTRLGVTSLSSFGVNFELMPITSGHVLLCNCLCCKYEASWFVVHNGRLYHGLEQVELDPLFFVNKPSQTIWLVKHKKWA